jgi:hypothetical protein
MFALVLYARWMDPRAPCRMPSELDPYMSKMGELPACSVADPEVRRLRKAYMRLPRTSLDLYDTINSSTGFYTPADTSLAEIRAARQWMGQ